MTKKAETDAIEGSVVPFKKGDDQGLSNLPADIRAELDAAKQEMASTIGELPANKISVKGKVFTLPGGQSQPGPLFAVILDYVWFNAYYEGQYKAGETQAPVCFAVGRVEKTKEGEPVMKPAEQAPKPQAESCVLCPKWEFGSDGAGKACKNQRRLVLVPKNATADFDPYTLYVSPSALKNFAKYIQDLKQLGLHPAQVVTEIGFDANQTYPRLTFKLSERHDNLQLFWALRDRAQATLFKTPEVQASKAA